LYHGKYLVTKVEKLSSRRITNIKQGTMKAITREIQQQMTPDDALARLKEGNLRFVEGKMLQRNLPQQVQETSGDQFPFAAVLGCIDSRAPAEHIFDQGIGDIFSTRIAGNIVNDDILGSLEFACKVSGAKLVLVLGHTACGAVSAACKSVKLGNLTSLLAKIKPAVEEFSDPVLHIDKVAAHNVLHSVTQIRQRSRILAEMEAEDEIQIIGAMYDVANGKVEILQQ
jgi:carbonic anhydrase